MIIGSRSDLNDLYSLFRFMNISIDDLPKKCIADLRPKDLKKIQEALNQMGKGLVIEKIKYAKYKMYNIENLIINGGKK